MTSARRETVVVIHGLWMNGIECGLLRRRLSNEHGFDTCLYGYRTVREGIAENIGKLGDFLKAIQSETIHLVGYSLGGVLALNYLHATDTVDPRISRVVCIGSPLTGSQAAQGFLRLPWGTEFLGKMMQDNVIENPMTEYTGQIDVGVIAGSLGYGAGQFFNNLNKPHDGTVAVSETRLPGIADHVEVHATHLGLLFSRTATMQTAQFLRHGEFEQS